MNLKKIISDYARYNHWANGRMTDWLKTLNHDLLYKETTSSFASVDLTLQHMNHAQNFWYAVLTEEDISKLDETRKINAVDAVMSELLAGSQRMIDSVEAFSDADLLKQVTAPAVVRSRYDFVLHVVNHNTYHRGQIVTIGRGLGATDQIPETDYDSFLWFEHQRCT